MKANHNMDCNCDNVFDLETSKSKVQFESNGPQLAEGGALGDAACLFALKFITCCWFHFVLLPRFSARCC